MVVHVQNLAGSADTGAQGALVREQIKAALAAGGMVTVSFAGVSTATSSFVNVCFVDLLRLYSFDDFKRRVRVVEATAQIIDMVKTRLTQAAQTESAPQAA